MKTLLALAALLLFVVPLEATTVKVDDPGFPAMVIPDGSVVTSTTYVPPGATMTGRWVVAFAFADGYGSEWDDYNDGGAGAIFFKQPVSNLTFHWYTTDSFVGGGVNSCRTHIACPTQGVATLAGPVSFLEWAIHDYGTGGITSMSYELPQLEPQIQASAQNIPEPGSGLLLAIALIGLVLLRWRLRPAVPTDN